MLFVIATTMTAGYQMISGPFHDFDRRLARRKSQPAQLGLCGERRPEHGLTLFMITAVAVILFQAVTRWINVARTGVIGRSMRIALRPLQTPLRARKCGAPSIRTIIGSSTRCSVVTISPTSKFGQIGGADFRFRPNGPPPAQANRSYDRRYRPD